VLIFYTWQLCFMRLSHHLGVHPSVCPSVTPWHCIKTVQAKITKSSPWAASRSLVYRDKISGPGCGGSRQTRVSKGVPPLKDVILTLLALIVWKRLQIGTHMLLIITSTGHGLLSFINIDDPEGPWTLQKRSFENFSQFLDAADISTLNCNEMAGDRPRQPAYEIFSIKSRFQQSKSRSPGFKEASTGRRQRRLPS